MIIRNGLRDLADVEIEKDLRPFYKARPVVPPKNGWLRELRQISGVPVEEIAKRLNTIEVMTAATNLAAIPIEQRHPELHIRAWHKGKFARQHADDRIGIPVQAHRLIARKVRAWKHLRTLGDEYQAIRLRVGQRLAAPRAHRLP